MLSFLFILMTAAHAQDATSIPDLIEMANQQATRGTTAGCNIQNTGHPDPAPQDCLELERKTIPDHLGRELPISVVSDQKLDSLKYIYNDKMRVYDAEVCAQRANKISDMLAKEGIETVKLFLEPGSFWPFWQGYIIPDGKARARYDGSDKYYTPYWKYHVVNIILVRDSDGRDQQYVIDPFMENLPVPRDQWEARLHENKDSSIATQGIMSRFNFGPGDYDEPRTAYDTKLLNRSYEIMNGDKP